MAKRTRDKLDDTMQLSPTEIQESLKKVLDDEDYDDDDDYEEADASSKALVVIAGIAVAVAIVICIVVALVLNTGSKETTTDEVQEPVATETATADSNTGSKANTGAAINLTQYQLQSLNTAIINALDEEYDAGEYTKPSTDQYELAGTSNDVIVKFDLTVGTMNKKNYIVPAKFIMSWDSSEEKYVVDSYQLDDDERTTSDFKSHSSKKDMKDAADKNTSDETEGKEVSSFDVNVRNGITVDMSCTSGTITVYAIAEDGTTTSVGRVTGGSATKSVTLPSGSYKLALYSDGATGYSWNYRLN